MTKDYFTDICSKNAKRAIDSIALLLDRNNVKKADERMAALQLEMLKELIEIKYLMRNLANLYFSSLKEEVKPTTPE